MERRKKYIEIRKEAREAGNGDSGRLFLKDEKDSNSWYLLRK